jgi:hypothetical protein
MKMLFVLQHAILLLSLSKFGVASFLHSNVRLFGANEMPRSAAASAGLNDNQPTQEACMWI